MSFPVVYTRFLLLSFNSENTLEHQSIEKDIEAQVFVHDVRGEIRVNIGESQIQLHNLFR